jgi:hypothetical protein
MAAEPPTRRCRRPTFFEVLWLVTMIAAAILLLRAGLARMGNAPVALALTAVGLLGVHLVFMLVVASAVCITRGRRGSGTQGVVHGRLDGANVPNSDMTPGAQRPDPRFPPRPDR